MKLLLAGLAARDQAALELFLRREKPDWHCASVPGNPLALADWPACDLLILDLAALGWSEATAAHAAMLAQRCGSTPALLVYASHDSRWVALGEQLKQPLWLWLAKPYNAQAMREALTELLRRRALPARQAPENNPPALANQALNASNLITPQVLDEAPQPVERARQALTVLSQTLAAAPADAHRLARSVLQACASGQPFELRFTLTHSALIHPGQAWVAGNVPAVVVRQVARSDTLAHAISLQVWPDDSAGARAKQLGWRQADLADWLLLLTPESA